MLAYSYRIPNPDEVSVICRFSYDENKNVIIPTDFDKTKAKEIRLDIMYP